MVIPTRILDVPINRFVVTFRCNDFWGKIVRGTTQGPSDIRNFLGETEIGDLQMTVSIQQQVFGLQITIDDVLGMKVFQGQGHFSGIEFGYWVWEPLQSDVSKSSGKRRISSMCCLDEPETFSTD